MTMCESRATSAENMANHQGTQVILETCDSYDKGKTSQQISAQDFAEFDYIIGMDEANIRDLKKGNGASKFSG